MILRSKDGFKALGSMVRANTGSICMMRSSGNRRVLLPTVERYVLSISIRGGMVAVRLVGKLVWVGFRILALFPRVVRGNVGADVAKHTVAGNLLALRTIGVHSCTFGGRRGISSCACNNNTKVLVRTRPICLTCRTVTGHATGGPEIMCLAPRKRMFGRTVTERVTRRRSLMFLYKRCRKVSRHILRRVIASCMSVKSCILANNRLPTVIVVSSVSEVIPNMLGGRRSNRARSFTKGLLRCPRCDHPRR